MGVRANADDWPQWRGLERDGRWNEQGIRDDLPDGQYPLAWSVDIGPGYCGPTVAKGRVYVMDRQVTDRNETERILCFDSAKGTLLWQVEYKAPYGNVGYAAGPRASVTIDQGRAFAGGARGNFHCLDAGSGELIWQHDLETEYSIDMPIWGIAASPLVYGELVLQQVGGSQNSCMVAFEKKTGKEVWRALNDKAGYCSRTRQSSVFRCGTEVWRLQLLVRRGIRK